jgi:hypothetical protein
MLATRHLYFALTSASDTFSLADSPDGKKRQVCGFFSLSRS